MNEDQRYRGVQADIKRLLDAAANDRNSGDMIGLGSVWLAAEMVERNELARRRAKETHKHHGQERKSHENR